MLVLTAKFGRARLHSRIISPDVDSRRSNLQACYAEYQWIMAYAEKFDVKIFQEELALCREMVTLPPPPPSPPLTHGQASLIPVQIAALSSHGSTHAASCG